MSNRGLFIVIALLLFGIITMMFIQTYDESPAEEISGSVSEVIEEAGDERLTTLNK